MVNEIKHSTYSEWLKDTDEEQLFLIMLLEARNPELNTEKAFNLAIKEKINVDIVAETLYWMKKKRDEK